MVRRLPALAIAVIVVGVLGVPGMPLGGAPAHARKVIEDAFFRDSKRPEPCGRNKSWPVIKSCLAKHFQAAVDVTYRTDTMMIVSIGSKADAVTRMRLYVKNDREWVRSNLDVYADDSNSVLRIEAFPTPHGDGVRIDVGSTAHTSVSLQLGQRAVPAVIRRAYSHVCVPGAWRCQVLMSTCETYVHGKVHWAFRGEPVWHKTLGVRLRGDGSVGGRMCTPAAWMLVDGDDAD